VVSSPNLALEEPSPPVRKTMILPIFVISAIAAGCGGSSYGGGDDSAPQAAKAAETAQAPADKPVGTPAVVHLKNTAFQPGDIHLHVGEKVTFENDDSFAHTVTATQGAKFDSGTLDGGKAFEFTADKAGKISYVCTFHPGMAGTITVS
jgi:plastocyanin